MRAFGVGAPMGCVHDAQVSIFVTKRGHVKVLDFGLAKVTASVGPRHEL